MIKVIETRNIRENEKMQRIWQIATKIHKDRGSKPWRAREQRKGVSLGWLAPFLLNFMYSGIFPVGCRFHRSRKTEAEPAHQSRVRSRRKMA